MPPAPRLCLPRAMRLADRATVGRVVQARRTVSRGPIVLYALPNGLDHPRLCITIRRSVCPAHRRNAIRRRIREAFRVHQHEIAPLDYVLSLRAPLTGPMLQAAALRPVLLELMQQVARRAAGRTRPPAHPASLSGPASPAIPASSAPHASPASPKIPTDAPAPSDGAAPS